MFKVHVEGELGTVCGPLLQTIPESQLAREWDGGGSDMLGDAGLGFRRLVGASLC